MTQLEIVKNLAAQVQAAQPWELKAKVLALTAAIIEWMEQHEGSGNGKNDTKSN